MHSIQNFQSLKYLVMFYVSVVLVIGDDLDILISCCMCFGLERFRKEGVPTGLTSFMASHGGETTMHCDHAEIRTGPR